MTIDFQPTDWPAADTRLAEQARLSPAISYQPPIKFSYRIPDLTFCLFFEELKLTDVTGPGLARVTDCLPAVRLTFHTIRETGSLRHGVGAETNSLCGRRTGGIQWNQFPHIAGLQQPCRLVQVWSVPRVPGVSAHTRRAGECVTWTTNCGWAIGLNSMYLFIH